MHRLVASATTLMILSALALWAPTSATAESVVRDGNQLMLVMDASGSMREPAADGEPKIDAAKKALGSLIDGLPDDQQVGLRVYGGKVKGGSSGTACTDSERLVGLGTDNRDQLRDAVADYTPFGATPIGYALQQAGKDLGPEGRRSIVLVSDGEPTCSPDPCEVAEQLSKNGIELTIDVVGFDVSSKARETLRCIADKGYGTYVDADDAESLLEGLKAAQVRASRPFDLTGEPIKGTPTPTDAPRIRTGQYLDTIPVDGPLTYRFERSAPGTTLHLGALFQGSAGSAGNGLRLAVSAQQDGQQTSCESGSAFGNGIGARAPLHFGSSTSWKSSADSPCNTADELIVEIEPTVGGDAIAQRPVQLMVYEEPAVKTTSGLPPAPATPTWETMKPAAEPRDDVVPGTSISNAPVVKPGTLSADINPGERQVFAVPVGWGENLQAQLDATLTPAVVKAAAVGSDIKVKVLSPMLGEDTVSLSGKEPSDWTGGPLVGIRDTPEPYRTGAMSQTVSWLNRGAPGTTAKAAALPGLRYVQVQYDVRGDDANLPYTLTLATRKSGETTAPDYTVAKGVSAPAASSRLVTRATPPDSSDAQGPGSGSGFPWTAAVLGGAGVLALAAASALVMRARRTV